MEKKQLTQEQIERISAGAHVRSNHVALLYALYMEAAVVTDAQMQSLAQANGVEVSLADAHILRNDFEAIALAR